MSGKNIKELRMEYEIGVQRLAAYTRIEQKELLDWEASIHVPDEEQLERLAQLFQVDSNELIDMKERSVMKKQRESKPSDQKNKKQKAKKGKTRKKTKQKTKYRTDHKTEKQIVVKKRRTWPLALVLLLLVADLAAGGGFLYWKYGDELLSQKQEYCMEDMAGIFMDENAHNGATFAIVLGSGGSFISTQNSCEGAQDVNGTWSISDHNIKATSTQRTYIFVVRSSNRLKYEGQTIYCGPYNKDIFTRGGVNGQTPQQEEKPQKQEDIAGTYSGNHNTLVISDATDTTLLYTLTSLNPENVQQVVTISGTAQRNGDTASFSFSDDGYGTQGSGSLTFQGTQVVLSIQKTQTDPQAVWGIFEEGTLSRQIVSRLCPNCKRGCLQKGLYASQYRQR